MSTVTLNNIKCTVNKQEYARNKQIALELIAAENQTVELEGMESCEIYKGEPIFMATVAVPGVNLGIGETVLKTYESPEILDVLIKAGIIQETGQNVQVGFTNCPIVQVIM